MKTLLLLLIAALFFPNVYAQERPDPNKPQGENLQVPEGWSVRLDHEMPDVVIGSNPDSADIYFVNMTPGWHITTGPAAIFYHPANTAEGNYKLEAALHHFDPGDRNREAFGLFFGGENLDNENQEYVYFLIRNTGEFLIKSRKGQETAIIQNWAASDAIVKYENTEESSVKNKLSVDIAEDVLRFLINDEQVTTINSKDIKTDGLFGLRINHSINVHISDLKLVE